MGTDHDQSTRGCRSGVLGGCLAAFAEAMDGGVVNWGARGLAAAGSDERGSGAVDDGFSGGLGRQNGGDNDSLVVVGRAVHDDLARLTESGEKGLDLFWSALADVGQGDALNVVTRDASVGLLHHPVTEVGAAVAKTGIFGELALRERDDGVADSCPVHAVDRDASGFDVGGADKDTVDVTSTDSQLASYFDLKNSDSS